MIVDCHTHVGFTGDNALPSEHPAAVETVGVSIVLAPAADDSDGVNEKLSEYVGKYEKKTVGFAHVDPTKDGVGVKNLKAATEKLGLKGVVLYCSDRDFHPAHSRAMKLYESAQDMGLPVFFHSARNLTSGAILNYVQPLLLDEVARAFPGLKIIIGNMGVPFVEQTLSLAAKHKNVYADLTIKPTSVWQVYNTVVMAHEREVMDKLFFGSGFPFGNAGQCIETLLGFNKLLSDTNLPSVPRGSIQNIIERDTLDVLGIKKTA